LKGKVGNGLAFFYFLPMPRLGNGSGRGKIKALSRGVKILGEKFLVFSFSIPDTFQNESFGGNRPLGPAQKPQAFGLGFCFMLIIENTSFSNKL